MDIEVFKERLQRIQPELEVVRMIKGTQKVEVKTKYGNCIGYYYALLEGIKPTIVSAVNKTEYFINEAIEIHGNTYDYSLTQYFESSNNIKIICKNHGIFEQRPNSHKIRKQGCSKCGNIQMKLKQSFTQKEFVKKANEVHNNFYDYSLTKYISTHSKIIVICPKHGQFFVTPASHCQNVKCKKCEDKRKGNLRKSNNKEFIEKSVKIHGNKYDYSKVNYKDNNTKVSINCNKCNHVFLQLPSSHLVGSGCPKCSLALISIRNQKNSTGWRYNEWEKKGLQSKKFDGFKVYIIKCFSDLEEFYKIGRTFLKIKNRFHSNSLPYKYEILKIIKGNPREMCELENKLHKEHINYKYIPLKKFNGSFECFSQIKL